LKTKSAGTNRFVKALSQSGVVLIFAVLLVGFAILTNGVSIRMSNIRSMLISTAATGLMAIGMTLVIIDRGIDLSVGGVAAISSAVGAICMTRLNVPWGFSVLIMLLIGVLVGFLNGVSIAILRMPPFICTMAMLKITTGTAHYILGGTTIYGLSPQHAVFGQSYFLSVPVCVWMLAVFMSIAFLVLRYSSFGRELYAMGGNPKAARLSGVNTERLMFFNYVNMGFLAGIAGLVFAARLDSATPMAGDGFELDAIGACYIGGASAYGGVGTVSGSVIGALIMGVLNNGMNIIGMDVNVQKLVKGLVLLAAVAFDVVSQGHVTLPSFLRFGKGKPEKITAR